MLETIRRTIQEVNAAPNLGRALQTVVKRSKDIANGDVCCIYLTDPENGQHVLRASEGFPEGIDAKQRMGLYEGLVGLVSEQAEVLNLDDASSHPRYSDSAVSGDQEFHSFLGVPIIQHRKVLGVLVVRRVVSEAFGESEVTVLVTLAAQLAGALAHAQIVGDTQPEEVSKPRSTRIVRGRAGAPGVGIGTVIVAYPPFTLDAIPDNIVDDPVAEEAVFRRVVDEVKDEIRELQKRLDPSLPEEDRALFDAYVLMLESDSLVEQTVERIRAGNWAAGALRHTIQEHVATFTQMEDSYLRERSSDIKDLGRRILTRLQSGKERVRDYPENTILVGKDLAAMHLAEVPSKNLVGIASGSGSSASHVAILANALGVPAAMGLTDLPVTRLEGAELIVDGYRGQVFINPTEAVFTQYERLAGEEAELSESLEVLRDESAITTDGVRIPLMINAGLLADLSPSLESGAEGIGLYRTEIPFMIRERFPGEQSQEKIYRQVLEAFAPRPVTIRSLDIGGDKMLPYFPIEEDNPFLGWRGIRVTLDHPDIFITQIRAMITASSGLDNLSIMLPMVSSVIEVDDSIALIRRAYEELQRERRKVSFPRIGVMIEVPSAVYLAGEIASRVDFLSVGTNDLTQYMLAVDRNNPSVADLFDSLHPAVLRAIDAIMRAADDHNKPVSVCGEMAGDPVGALLLCAMGVDSLSMNIGSLPRVKMAVRGFSMSEAKALLVRVLASESVETIREITDAALDERDLGGLIRAGI